MLGKQIANYRIEEKLGEGGMGIVYRAIDLDLDRPVAIKVLSAELSRDSALLERFRAEAKAQAHLNHANIASLYTLLNVEGHMSIVMEYLEGETLDQILRRRGLIPWEEAVPWFKQALLGIGFAHRRGIVHRDIKPSNIMVNRYGTVKVMDFGIAKVLGGQRLTQTGTHVGTIAYMSPEQVRNRPVDVRSDIYSLGVTLYELLTAHLPFESDSEFQVMSDHVSTPPPPPSRHYPYIPPGIEQAVLKALAKDPDARFQSVEEFGAALEHPERMNVPPAATVVDPSAAARYTSSFTESTMAGRSQNPAPTQSLSDPGVSSIPPNQNKPPSSSPMSSRRNSKKVMISVGVLLAVMLVALGSVTLRRRPVAAVTSQLGGGGEIASGTSLTSQRQPGIGQDRSRSPGPEQTSAPTGASSSSDSSIVKALGSDKDVGKQSFNTRQDPTTPSRRARTSRGATSGSNPRKAAARSDSTPSADDQPPTPPPSPTPPAGPSEAELNNASEALVKIRARMDAVHQSLANLKQQQAAEGLGLRGDIVASESRLYSYFQMADRSIQQRDVASAEKNMDQAEQELTKLEHFLGR